jgi:dihydrofolate reductase
MRDLVVTEFITLDGIVDSPGGGDHPHAGWSFSQVEFHEAAYEIKGREQEEAGAVLVGRHSWEEFEPVWPSMTEEFERYNKIPKYVVSTSLAEDTVAASQWQPMTLLRSLDEVAELKQGDGGPIYVHGSATLAQGLAAAGLVDRYHLLVFPLLLGSGKRLFADGSEHLQKLRLVDHAAYPNGIQLNVLEVTR